MKKSTIVLIYTDKQFRTFIESDAFEELRHSGDVVFVFTNNLKPFINNQNLHVKYVPKFPNILQKSGTLIATARLWKNRFRTPAHLLRAELSFSKKKDRAKYSSMILYNMEGWSNYKRSMIRLISNTLITQILYRARHKFMLKFLDESFRASGLDITEYKNVFIPYSGLLTHEFDDYVDFFNFNGICTIAIQENWDNLSSKTFIASSPKYFCVWGEQSLGHLVTVHRLSRTIPIVVGSPRFQPYFSESEKYLSYKTIHKDLVNQIKLPYVLFTGTGDGVDDAFILKETLSVLSSNKKYSLVYRPHPFTRNPVNDQDLKFFVSQNVVIDHGSKSKSVFHHCGLIMNADLIINQFSTMLLEAIISNKKVLLPTFVNRPVKYNYSNAINEWPHFVGLVMIPNVYVSNSSEEFSEDLKKSLEAETKKSRFSANWMCAELNSSEEFLKLVKKLNQ
jgi:hypothetical protein